MLSEDMPLGRGSYTHGYVLWYLARCLSDGGQSAAAEGRLREALAIVVTLVNQQPENQVYIGQRAAVLNYLGDALRDQGKYGEAQIAYEEAQQIYEQKGDLRNQAVVLGQLGNLALVQNNYAEARSRYTATLKIFRRLGEPKLLAGYLRNLGIVAERQKEWIEAER